ncbi:hypothetical protein GC089_12445 [Cellulomonas sp. JZ18]|uniref:hypothetical protein n=1 Tax=Cellulomonas sp. JZ18 TaxID=2654191 RepID=UPI0012D4291C|nr:hypothetical protein [Cellulomonas sp. JZ18]QGQ19874.1 hypothetical protein GC089_12445 [Cellulomonas sp. JZ18]
MPVRVVLDPDPDGPPSTVRTARRAWRPWHASATHHLLLQDDVTLPPDFGRHVTAAVAARPDAALSFFSEWGSFTSHALRVGAYAGYPWVRQPDTYLATQALVLPVGHADALAHLLAGADLDEPDDHAVHRYVTGAGIEHLVSSPNLVQHDDRPSVVGNGAMGARRATVPLAASAPPSATWWRGDALTSLRRVPSVFWRHATPSSYEQGPGPAAPWVVAPTQRTFGDAHEDVVARVHAMLRSALRAPVDGPVGAVLPDVAVTTAAQLAVARALRAGRRGAGAAPADAATADAAAAAAARTVAPGGLRTLDPQGAVDWARIGEAMVRVAARVEDELLPSLDLCELAQTHTWAAGSVRG